MTRQVNREDVEALVLQFNSSDVRELHVRFEDFEIYLTKDRDSGGLGAGQSRILPNNETAPVAPPVSAPAPKEPLPEPDALSGRVFVRAGYLGTFYRSPKPGEAPYVEVGTAVVPETDLCLIEVMKLFTAIRAGVAGKIVQILAEDGEMVAEGQPLFVIETE